MSSTIGTAHGIVWISPTSMETISPRQRLMELMYKLNFKSAFSDIAVGSMYVDTANGDMKFTTDGFNWVTMTGASMTDPTI